RGKSRFRLLLLDFLAFRFRFIPSVISEFNSTTSCSLAPRRRAGRAVYFVVSRDAERSGKEASSQDPIRDGSCKTCPLHSDGLLQSSTSRHTAKFQKAPGLNSRRFNDKSLVRKKRWFKFPIQGGALLSKEDNEFACRVGSGTPMGELF